MPKRNRTARAQRNRSPHSQVLVARHGIPVDPIIGTIARLGREDLNRKSIGCSRTKALMHLKFVGAEGAPHLRLISYLFSVKPDVGAVVDAIKLQPGVLVAIAGGNLEFGAV